MLADHPDVSDNLLLLLLQQTDISTALPFCLNSLYLNTLDPYESVSKCQNKPFLPWFLPGIGNSNNNNKKKSN